MVTRVQKWGNSLALRIPKSFAFEAGISNQSRVDVSVVDGKLIIVPMPDPPTTLEQLLTQVTEENLHCEFNTGPAAGREIW
jgi:antitoxin MazE